MKIYPVKQYNAIQYRKGAHIVPRRTGWVACLDRGVVVTNTKQQAVKAIERRKHETLQAIRGYTK